MSIVESPQSDGTKKTKGTTNTGLPVWIETDDDKFIRRFLRSLGRAITINEKNTVDEEAEKTKLAIIKEA